MNVSPAGVVIAVLLAIGAFVLWRGSKVVGGVLLASGVVLAGVVLAEGRSVDVDVRTPSLGDVSAKVDLETEASFVVRAGLVDGTTTAQVDRLERAWADLPGVLVARGDRRIGIVLYGEPGADVAELDEVLTTLRDDRHVDDVRRVR